MIGLEYRYTPNAFEQLRQVLKLGGEKHPDTEASPLLRDPETYRVAMLCHLDAADADELDPDTEQDALAHVAARALLLLEKRILENSQRYPNVAPQLVPQFEVNGSTWVLEGHARDGDEPRRRMMVPPLLRRCGHGWRWPTLKALQQRAEERTALHNAQWSVERRCGLWSLRVQWPTGHQEVPAVPAETPSSYMRHETPAAPAGVRA